MSDRVRIADYLNNIAGYAVYHYGDSSDFIKKVTSTIGNHVDTEKIREEFNPEKIAQIYKTLYLSL